MVHTHDPAPGAPRSATALADVRRALAHISGNVTTARTAPLGPRAIDTLLPGGGLALAALHEVAGLGASGFTAALTTRLAQSRPGLVVWCQHRRRVRDEGDIYGPGLGAFGIRAQRLLLVDAAHDKEVLWAMEEALRSAAVAVVVGEVERIDLQRTRRLQLAAEAGGAAGLLLRPVRPWLEPSAAVSRWRVRPIALPRRHPGEPAPLACWPGELAPLTCWPGELAPLAWNAELWRVKGAVPSRFEVCFDEPTLRFALVADLAHRSLPTCGAACG